MKSWILAGALGASLMLASPASALVIQLTSSDQGHWSAVNPNPGDNTSYYTGFVGGDEIRSFFTFDLTGVNFSGYQLLDATFHIDNPLGWAGVNLWFNQVTSSPSLLGAGGPGSPTLWQDLGIDANSYGYTYVTHPTYTVVRSLSFPSFLNDIVAHQGQLFTVGISVDPSTPGAIFGSSGLPIQLDLNMNFVPEPNLATLLRTL